MRALLLVLPFVALTFCSWGIYGPVLHEGQHDMGVPLQPSSLRPFICVGVAYFLIAVVVPVAWLWSKGETGHWTFTGTVWSFAAGMAGAVGALGIILAFKFRGSPVFVMPLVFGLAPVVNTFVTMFMTKTFRQANVVFFAGVIVVAIGAAGVMWFKPSAKNIAVETNSDGSISVELTEIHGEATKTTQWKAASLEELETNEELAKAHKLYLKKQPITFRQFLLVIASIAMTALCWGSYGPVLHKGQMKMAGSRLRPFLCVGLAYFLVAVIAPVPLLAAFDEPGGWTTTGVIWSLAAGAAGAVGALGIILAFNFGGKPIFVMPLVFGGAPVVNTLTTVWHEGTGRSITAPFYASLMLVIGGAVTVLIFSPKPKPKKTDAGKREQKNKSSKSKHTKAESTQEHGSEDAEMHQETMDRESNGEETIEQPSSVDIAQRPNASN